MAKVVNNVTELIGGTPLVRLNRIVPEGSAEVFVKLSTESRFKCERPYRN